jgi:hypothetical protein
MAKESHSKNMQRELDILRSRLDALEVSSTDRYDKSMISVLKVLVENQKNVINEFEHLKKAIDLLTLQIFKVEKNHNS